MSQMNPTKKNLANLDLNPGQMVNLITYWVALSVCSYGLRGPLAYSLLGGGIPTQSIG